MSSKKHRKKIKRMHEPIKAYTVVDAPTDAMQTLRDGLEWIRKHDIKSRNISPLGVFLDVDPTTIFTNNPSP